MRWWKLQEDDYMTVYDISDPKKMDMILLSICIITI